MAQYLIDLQAGCVRPMWTDNEAIGFLVEYLDAFDRSPAEEQMATGYMRSAGTSPYPHDVSDWRVENLDTVGGARLVTDQYGDPERFREVSRCTAGDRSTVIMFESAMTAVIRDGNVAWLARLD